MVLHFSPAFDEGVYPLPEDRDLAPNERFIGESGLLMLLERDLGLTGGYPDDEERALLYKKALKAFLEANPDAFFSKSFLQDEIAVAEKLLSWRDELVMSGIKRVDDAEQMPCRLQTLMEVERIFEKNGFQSYGMADRWQDVMAFLPGMELSVTKIVLHEVQSLLHPFFIRLFDELSKKIKVEESLFEIQPDGDNNLHQLQRALQKGETHVKLRPLQEDASLIFLNVKDNYVAGDFMADQINNGYQPLVFNGENAVFDSCLAASGLPASGSVNFSSTPQIIQLFKLVSTGLFSPVNVKNLLSYLQLPYLPFSRYLASRLASQLAEMPGINNEKWNQIISDYLENVEAEDVQKYQRRKTELETFLVFNEAETNTVLNIRNRYRALKKWVDQYPHLDVNDVKEEEKEQFLYLEQLCRNLLNELNDMADEEEVSEARFSRILESIYKPGTFRYFHKQVGSLPVFSSPGVLTEQAPKVCWFNWQNGRQTGHPLAFLNRQEWDFLSDKGCMLYLPEYLDQFRYFTILKGIMAASEQLVLVIPEIVGGEASVPHALAGDINAAVENPGVVSLSQVQMDEWSQYFTTKTRQVQKDEIALPQAVLYVDDLDAIRDHHKRDRESPSSIESLIQNPFDWVGEYLAQISGAGTLSLPDLFRQKGQVTHAAVEQMMRELKDNPGAVFDEDKIRSILYQNINQKGLEFLLPENRFELHETELQFIESVKVLLNIIRVNNLKVSDVEIFKNGTIHDIGDVTGFIDLLLTDESGSSVVFDLKWTFKSKKYATQIEEEKDLQLILYRELMRQETGTPIKTGYFLLNDGKLYTRYDFAGKGVVKMDTASTEEEMLRRIVNSVTYRRREFEQGRVELGEEFKVTDLDYGNDAEEQDLFPLNTDSKNNKRVNYYSNLKLFKGKIY